MINAIQIQGILSLYRQHGWTLRRVLLTDTLQTQIRDQLQNLFGAETTFVSAEIDAIWFSRISVEGNEAWEIRHLSQIPFALIEVFDEDEDETVREERLHEMEILLRDRINLKKSSGKSH